jgi:hypothetical protein
LTKQEHRMASTPPSRPADKPQEPKKKGPALPAAGEQPASARKGERPIADVDRKVRGGDA